MFEYLKDHLYQRGGTDFKFNFFEAVELSDINEAEKILEFTLPSQLKQFYQEVGSGNLRAPNVVPEGYDFYSANEFLPPLTIARFVKGERFWEGQKNYISEDALELLQPGDLPFFEIHNNSSFLKMKALSDNPNAVWTLNPYNPIKIEDSLEEFIKNLYYKDPAYYGDIIEAHYAKVKH